MAVKTGLALARRRSRDAAATRRDGLDGDDGGGGGGRVGGGGGGIWGNCSVLVCSHTEGEGVCVCVCDTLMGAIRTSVGKLLGFGL